MITLLAKQNPVTKQASSKELISYTVALPSDGNLSQYYIDTRMLITPTRSVHTALLKHWPKKLQVSSINKV